MRVFGLVIGFAAGAYLMWAVAVPVLDRAGGCDPDTDCGVVPATSPSPSPAQPGLNVVVYDPAIEPRLRTADEGPYIPGWTSAEGAIAQAPLPLPIADNAAPRGFKVIDLDQANARGACAVLNGQNLGCLALVDPG